MTLIPNVGQWHRLWSLRFSILSAFFSSVVIAYNNLPADWISIIPHWMKEICSVGALISAGLAAISRVVKQENLSG